MQPKKSAAGKKSSGGSATGNGDTATATQARVGRPPSSPLDRKGQVRENVRAHRAKLKAAGMEKVETYLPTAWRQFLQDSGVPLQQLGTEAFALLLKERGAANLVQATQQADTDGSNPS